VSLLWCSCVWQLLQDGLAVQAFLCDKAIMLRDTVWHFLSSLFALVFFLLGSISRLPQMIILLALHLNSRSSLLILLTVKNLLNIKLFKIKIKILKIIASEYTNTFVCVCVCVCVCEMWSLFISVYLTYCGYYLKSLIHFFFAFVCSRPYFYSELCVIFLCVTNGAI
jgi:hypothetical protein